MPSVDLDSGRHSAGGVGDLIVTAVERHGPRTAFIDGARTVSYAQFGQDVACAIRTLRSIGVVPGQAVLQLSANCYHLVVLMAACYAGGFVSVAPQHTGSLDDHRHVLDDCGAVVLVVDGPRAARAAALAAGRHGLRVFAHVRDAGLPAFWDQAGAGPLEPLAATDRPQDIVRLIYTGGTTGRPKAVITLSSQLAFASLLHVAEQQFTPATRLLVTSPITHGAGSFIVPVLMRGGAVVIEDGFDPGRVTDAVARRGVTALFLVPTMLYVLLDDPRVAADGLPGVTRIIYAAAPIAPARLHQALRLFGPILSQNYGLTEVPGTVLTLSPEDHVDPRASRLASAGKTYPCVTVRLLDDAGVPVRPGEVGEICVRAPHATPGYWRQPEATAELWRGGWLHTGDMARQDPDGYVHVVDRKRDMIVSGGFNVYPAQVEGTLASHPAVAGAAVIGVPHAKWGEAVHAFIVLRPGHAAGTEALIRHVRDRDGAVPAPKAVTFLDTLPLTALGKVDKKRLRAPFWAGQARAVG